MSLEQTDAYYTELGGYSYTDEQVDRWLQRWFCPFVRLVPGLRVLDLCCGDGVWSFGLLRLEPSLQVEGFELSGAAVEQAGARARRDGLTERTRFTVYDAEQPLPPPDESFDVIFARGLFLFNQHDMLRPAALALLDSWHRLLKPGGVFFAAYGSRPEQLGSYTPVEETVLPMNAGARQSPVVDFQGGKYNHTEQSFAAPFAAAKGVGILLQDFTKGRHTLLSCRSGDERAALSLEYPDRDMQAGESFTLHFFPPHRPAYELELRGGGQRIEAAPEGNRWTCEGLEPGSYRARVRYAEGAWSLPLDLTVHPEDADLQDLRTAAHRASLMVEKDTRGVTLLTDPGAKPPAWEEGAAWFPTPCFDGSTMLVNESAGYYRDPLAYYLRAMNRLLELGAEFVTWHDLLDGTAPGEGLRVLIQFDVDAGPRSMQRLCRALMERGIRASIMTHWKAEDWYRYGIEALDVALLQQAEREGWTIGYHNNSLTRIGGMELTDYSEQQLGQAQAVFAEDVEQLRAHFTIRSFTHHGGNTLNHQVQPPEGLDIAGVDKPVNPELWKTQIAGAFSDGGFLSRPVPLLTRVEQLVDAEGCYFFRNHPVKYGNYEAPHEIAPLGENAEDLEKQARWMAQRIEHRIGRRLSHLAPDKPLSRAFKPFRRIRETCEGFRATRRDTFLRQYPWILGDPRVFWWRMLEAFGPESGTVLNVGALPREQRRETTAFLAPGVEVLEMDIDSGREPDIFGDITEPMPESYGRYAGVLLFGLPYVHSPSIAVRECERLCAPGGVGLFGFSADTHPFRGGMWDPGDRPVWRKEQEPLRDIGLRGRLWSFGASGLEELFDAWDEVAIENFNHYWFVRCRKAD